MTCQRPECKHFPGRLNELCNGTALDKHGVPIADWIIDAWRAKEGLAPINSPIQSMPIPAGDQPKRNFAYITGTNRMTDISIARTMVWSMRKVGVKEDVHLFAPGHLESVINHHVPLNSPWKNFMAKVDFVREMADSDYDYIVSLDTDNFFVRHPGDLETQLLRDNPLWVQMEGDADKSESTKRPGAEWWSVPWTEIRKHTRWNTNAGMWIVRREFIPEFCDRMYEIFNDFHSRGFSKVTEELPLAIVGIQYVKDPELNTPEHTSHVWACDWNDNYKDRLPDGKLWKYQVWLSGESWYTSPAIVHAMRSKSAMLRGPVVEGIAAPREKKEPVGTHVAEILKECGIDRPACGGCSAWVNEMDYWGVEGCTTNRSQIIARLNEQSHETTWIDLAKVALKGYMSSGAILDEAIKRATNSAKQSSETAV